MRVLYISYDGLLDPLGQSQILPYLKGISSYSQSIEIISFEKSIYTKEELLVLKNNLRSKNIHWHPLRFTSKYGALGKLWDLFKLYIFSFYIALTKSIQIVHARGHVCSQAAYLLKKILLKKMIFDFRGFWVDERVDKGGWNLSYLTHRLQFYFFKSQEKLILNSSDQVVVLTKKALYEIIRITKLNYNQITVIPCCADYEHFYLQSPESMKQVRDEIGIPNNVFVFGYLGSMGKMYNTDSVLKLFTFARESPYDLFKSAWLLLITPNKQLALDSVFEHVPKPLQRYIIIKSASRAEMPSLIHTLNVMVSFITVTYARIGSSPTKIGESLSVGVPVIANAGIGDLDNQITELNAGFIVKKTDDRNLKDLLKVMDTSNVSSGRKLREQSRGIFGLDHANSQYKNVYSKIINL
jgi:glycosyltransferase involved in cell wall biosynthesis